MLRKRAQKAKAVEKPESSKEVNQPTTSKQKLVLKSALPKNPLQKNKFDQKCKPSTICLKRTKLTMSGKNDGKDIERSILNGRYFYHFSIYSNNWTLFVFDSFYKQSFTIYNASELKGLFYSFFFHFVPYDLDYGLIYDDDKVVKVKFDHEAKKLRTVGDPFVLSRENEYRVVFEIHTVEIMKNDVVFIYTCRDNTNVAQRLYLQKWSNLTEKIKMCKIGIRDGLDLVQFVSGQFLNQHQLCIIHMQDKNRQFGLIIPLVLFWNTEGDVSPEKFEKMESENGQPFFKKLKTRVLEKKNFTGAWHGHLFTYMISRSLPKSKRTSISMFVFNGLTKIWAPLNLPTNIKLSRASFLTFSNSGNEDDTKLMFYSKTDKFPTDIYRMAVKTPDKLEQLCQIRAAQLGIFNTREQSLIVDLEVERETDLRKEHQRQAKEHQKKAKEHLIKLKELKGKQKQLKKRDHTGKILPPIY